MKKLFLIVSLFITANTWAQNTLIWGQKVQATQSLQLKTKRVTDFSDDSTDLSKSPDKLITERAAKAYMNRSYVASSATVKIDGEVIYDSLLIFHTTTITGYINGILYTAAPTTITLSAAHSTLQRQDVFYLDTTGHIGVLPGTPGIPAALPTVDPASQLYLTSASILAGATVPGNISNLVIFKENTEWTLTGTASGLTGNNLTNSFAGAKSIRLQPIINGQYLELTSATTESSSEFSYLTFRLRLDATLATTTRLVFSFYNGTTLVTRTISLASGTYGYVRTVSGTYMLGAIPMSDFYFLTSSFTKLRIALTGSSTAGIQLDDVQLQRGGITASASGVNSWNGLKGDVLQNFKTINGNVITGTGDIVVSGSTDTTWLNNRINQNTAAILLRPDSIRRVGVNWQYRKNGAWITYGTDSLGIGGGSTSNTVTEQKIYYRGEYYANKKINTTTGAITSNTGTAITDYIRITGGESVTISVPNGYSNVVIYGWTYDTTLTAISEIRSNALIGTTLKTYTFTTPSNARFLNIYIKYGGLDFAKALSIKSTNTITYNTPITPEQFTGTKSVPIQKALDFARFTSTGVTLNGSYLIDSSLILSSGSTLILHNAKIQLDSGSHTNIIRNEAVANPDNIFARGNRDIKIMGIGNAIIQGSIEAWGGGGASGVGTQYWRPIAVLFAAVENFQISGITFKNSNMWTICAEQSRWGSVKDLNIIQDSSHANQDGINVRRGSNRILIENIRGNSWDDIVALTNLKAYPEYNILDSTFFYQPYATNLDIHDIIVKDIQRDTTGFFPGIAPIPFYKAGVLLLCEDSLKIHDVTIDGISGPQQVQVQYSSIPYWRTTQATVDDVYNIGISNTHGAKINIDRPIKNSSFFNISSTDISGNPNAVFPSGVKNTIRRYYDGNFEFYDATGVVGSTSTWNTAGQVVSVSDRLGSTNNASVKFKLNNIDKVMFDSTGKYGFNNMAPAATIQVDGIASSVLSLTSFLAPAMTNNQRNYHWLGKDVSTTGGFNIVYNHNTTTADRFLSIQDNNNIPGGSGSLVFTNAGIGVKTITPASHLDLDVNGNLGVGGGTSKAYMQSWAANGETSAGALFGTYSTGDVVLFPGLSTGGAGQKVVISYYHSSTVKSALEIANETQNLLLMKTGGKVGIGTTSPDASSVLDITSTTKGVLLPRMTKTQRDAISSPATGLMIYQTDNTQGLRVYNGTNWMRFTETAD